MYEGTPAYPDVGRPWRIAERLGVNIFHTSPTSIRMLRKAGPDEPATYDYHFKSMTKVGEPIEPEVWRWYHQAIGKGEAVITDTWWLTETGGFLGATLPALQPMKPGSCGPGALGIYPVIYDENRNEIEPGSGRAGNICIRNPWPGIMQTIWGDPTASSRLYYAKYNTNRDSQDWHEGLRCDREPDRQDRPAQEHLDRPRHAQDPVREDHAPGDRARWAQPPARVPPGCPRRR